MKKLHLLLCAVFAAVSPVVTADIVVPGADGSDCDLTVTQNTIIDLSQATTAAWNANYNVLAAADPTRVASDYIGKGLYDPEKWAVVFRYTEVSIAAGATVTFINHPSRAPVVWLVSGSVDIQGTVNLDGAASLESATAPLHPEPGPGGFRGALGSYWEYTPAEVARYAGHGFGPGGGGQDAGSVVRGLGGSHATMSTSSGAGNSTIYGNPTLIPLLGGSGGGAQPVIGRSASGGSGGGAILIAAQMTFELGGAITANGGPGIASNSGESGGGSGGGIRLVSSSLSGSGSLSAIGGGGWSTGGQGRIRLERQLNTNIISVSPAPSTQLLIEGGTATLWLPDTAPSAELISFAGVQPPADPRSAFGGSSGPDLIVGDVPTSQAIIHTTNLPAAGSLVQVRITPRHDSPHTVVNATFDSEVSAVPLVLKWVADVPITNGYSALQIRILTP